VKNRILEFKELRPSREILEAREPSFIVWLIYIVLCLFIGVGVWIWFGELEVVVRSEGIVRPKQDISVVYNRKGGVVEKKSYEAGDKVEEGDLLYKLEAGALKTTKEMLEKKMDKLEVEISSLERLEKSIRQGENLFNPQGERKYYSRYLDYKYQKNQLKLDYNQAKNEYYKKKNLSSAAVAKSELERLKMKYEAAKLKLESYQTETITGIQNKIESKQEQLSQSREEYIKIKENIAFKEIKAPIEGTIQVLNSFNEGDYVPGGIKALRILPGSESNYRMELTVSNEDISKIEEGQKVRYRFLALPYREYGALEGKIIDVPNAAEMIESNTANSKNPYKIEASIADTKLTNNDGETKYIKPGMISKVRIVADKKRLLYFILEKLNFLS